MAQLLVSRSSPAEFQSFGGYRFGVQGRSANSSQHRLGVVLRRAIEAIADSKLRGLERELELLGISMRETK